VKLWPVFVPTKGRAGKITPEVRSLAPTLLVEEAEADGYAAAEGLGYRVHPESGRGVSYARNQVLARARAAGFPWVWMLDDDLQDFRRRPDDAPLSATEALHLAQGWALSDPAIAMAGLPVDWAKPTEAPVVVGHCLYSCVALKVEVLAGLAYRETLPIKEDLDFTLQVLARGWKAARLDLLTYRMPYPGSAEGGLFETYREADRREKAAAHLAELWPGIVEHTPGAKSERVNWNRVLAELAAIAPERAGFPVPVHQGKGRFFVPSFGASRGY
jgi:hypothetical protein